MNTDFVTTLFLNIEFVRVVSNLGTSLIKQSKALRWFNSYKNLIEYHCASSNFEASLR